MPINAVEFSHFPFAFGEFPALIHKQLGQSLEFFLACLPGEGSWLSFLLLPSGSLSKMDLQSLGWVMFRSDATVHVCGKRNM